MRRFRRIIAWKAHAKQPCQKVNIATRNSRRRLPCLCLTDLRTSSNCHVIQQRGERHRTDRSQSVWFFTASRTLGRTVFLSLLLWKELRKYKATVNAITHHHMLAALQPLEAEAEAQHTQHTWTAHRRQLADMERRCLLKQHEARS